MLHGPHVCNFAEIYAALDDAGGAELVTDAGKLAVRIGAWLKDAERAQGGRRAGLRSRWTRWPARCERTLAALDPYLMQFRLERRADNA